MYCNFGKSVYLHYTSYSTYLIYRGHSYNTLQYIDEMPAGGNTSYTDNNAPGGTVYYQIVVSLTPDAKDDSQGIIRSNIATDEDEVGIGDVSDNYCNIYQHSGNIVVETPHSHKVQVYDMMGRLLHDTFTSGYDVFSVPASGVYIVNLQGLASYKVVVIK